MSARRGEKKGEREEKEISKKKKKVKKTHAPAEIKLQNEEGACAAQSLRDDHLDAPIRSHLEAAVAVDPAGQVVPDPAQLVVERHLERGEAAREEPHLVLREVAVLAPLAGGLDDPAEQDVEEDARDAGEGRHDAALAALPVRGRRRSRRRVLFVALGGGVGPVEGRLGELGEVGLAFHREQLREEEGAELRDAAVEELLLLFLKRVRVLRGVNKEF